MPISDLLARMGGPQLVARELGMTADESGRVAQTLPSSMLDNKLGGGQVWMLDMNGGDNALDDVRQMAGKKPR